MLSVHNKVVIVTGAANGIGAHIVAEFLKENAKFVAILDVDESAGRKIKNELTVKYGENTTDFFKCDVTKTEEIFSVFNKVFNDNGTIDVVVNNAGIANETLDTYIKEIEINFTAVVTSTLKALELMRRDHGGRGGTIINISSILALSKDVGVLHIYAATKNAVLTFSNRLGMDHYYSHTKVRVLTVCFGAVGTQLLYTCKGFDEIANNEINLMVDHFKCNSVQTSAVAAKGVIEAYKKGKSGDTWLISKNKFMDITSKVNEADKILFNLDLI